MVSDLKRRKSSLYSKNPYHGLGRYPPRESLADLLPLISSLATCGLGQAGTFECHSISALCQEFILYVLNMQGPENVGYSLGYIMVIVTNEPGPQAVTLSGSFKCLCLGLRALGLCLHRRFWRESFWCC